MCWYNISKSSHFHNRKRWKAFKNKPKRLSLSFVAARINWHASLENTISFWNRFLQLLCFSCSYLNTQLKMTNYSLSNTFHTEEGVVSASLVLLCSLIVKTSFVFVTNQQVTRVSFCHVICMYNSRDLSKFSNRFIKKSLNIKIWVEQHRQRLQYNP